MSEATQSDPGDDAASAEPSSEETPDASPKAASKKKPAPTLWERATLRWAAISGVMASLLVLYTLHPYYLGGQFAPWRTFYTAAFVVWLAGGLFYVRATLVRFSDMRYTMRDGGLHILLLAKAWQTGKFWRVAKNPRVRTTLLGILVKSFFTPLMTGFVSGHLSTICDLWLRHKHVAPFHFNVQKTDVIHQTIAWFSYVGSRLPEMVPRASDFAGAFQPWTTQDVSWFLDLAYNIVFLVDVGWAMMGYAGESRWLGNKTRSVEPTPFGWAVCLACYPPYNNVLGTYLPLENGTHHGFSETTLLVLRGVTVALFAIYASATVSFGFKFSNLTNRGIVARGPYRFVRHPAYLCKCSAWWLEHVPTMTLTKAVFLSMLCGVYALRAWTEERHLGRDPEYREYKKKTPWVLFPGVY